MNETDPTTPSATAPLPDRPRPALNILIIEDDEPLAFGLGKLLERHGFRVRIATRGRHGIDLVNSTSIDLVITDIYMSEMEGLEIIMKLRRERPGLKVIAMSGGSPYVGVDCLSMARTLGAAEIVRKPVRIGSLLAIIQRLQQKESAPGPDAA